MPSALTQAAATSTLFLGYLWRRVLLAQLIAPRPCRSTLGLFIDLSGADGLTFSLPGLSSLALHCCRPTFTGHNEEMDMFQIDSSGLFVAQHLLPSDYEAFRKLEATKAAQEKSGQTF